MYHNGMEDKACVHLFVFIYLAWYVIDKKNVLVTTFQSWVHMYPYHTETAAIVGIKPITIHTN